MDQIDRSDPSIQKHTEAMRRLLTSFENGDIRVQTFTVGMNQQVHALYQLLSLMKDE